MRTLGAVGHRHDAARRRVASAAAHAASARTDARRRSSAAIHSGDRNSTTRRMVPITGRGAVTVGAYHPAVPLTRRPTGVPPSLAEVGGRAEARIVALLDGEIERWRAVDSAVDEPLVALRELVLAGGKRLRPAFCHWAFVGAGGDPDEPGRRRRCRPRAAAHVRARPRRRDGRLRHASRAPRDPHVGSIAMHRQRGWRGEPRRFGEGAAILVGDFAFVYADVLFGRAAGRGTPSVRRAPHRALRRPVPRPRRHRERVAATLRRQSGIERYKSGKYTVERPLHLGAALAGRLDELAASLSRDRPAARRGASSCATTSSACSATPA